MILVCDSVLNIAAPIARAIACLGIIKRRGNPVWDE
jgi:hypothetical protein